MQKRIIRMATGLLVLFGFLLQSGCVLNRVASVKQQACHADENFRITQSDGMQIQFLKPVMLYQDIVSITGIEPNKQKLAEGKYAASYQLKTVGGSASLSIPINLLFELHEDELKLTDASVQSPFAVSIPGDQLSQAMQQACNTSLPLWSTQLETDMPEIDPTLIPSRKELVRLAGEPTQQSIDGRELHYDFVLQGAEDDGLHGSIQVSYDASGSKLLRTRTRFSHYLSVADFEQGKVWGSITL